MNKKVVKQKIVMKPREAAYLALLSSLKKEGYITQFLSLWQQKESPSAQDYALAYEIATGACKMRLALNEIAAALASKNKVSLKLKELALLHTALYQCVYLDRVPLYAIANESTEIAKRYCHQTFANFLNAILRKFGEFTPKLPEGNNPKALSTRLSYPQLFVESLILRFGVKQAVEILEAENISPKTFVRIRPETSIDDPLRKELEIVHIDESIPKGVIGMIKSTAVSWIKHFSESQHYYIQNITPISLVYTLAKMTPRPKRILDLCAAPGGKLLAAHDLFPEAKLYGNDLTEEKIVRLRQNLEKYQVNASLSIGEGQDYSDPYPFDLVILDVPCSNSGVLNKRAEARWRITKEEILALNETQMKLLQAASKLISDGGSIWYMTCSILEEENEMIVEQFCKNTHFKLIKMITYLPNINGVDGGFGALLKKPDRLEESTFIEQIKTKQSIA